MLFKGKPGDPGRAGQPGHPGQRLLDFRAFCHRLNWNNFHDDTILGPVEDIPEASLYLPFLLALVQFTFEEGCIDFGHVMHNLLLFVFKGWSRNTGT